MRRRQRMIGSFAVSVVAVVGLWAVLPGRAARSAGEAQSIALLKPKLDTGRSLMQALNDRKSTRSFSAKPLPDQMLSNLLWAAFGVNRPKSGKRTAPSASNRQEIDIYVATAQGLYLFDARAHALRPVLSADIREITGRQAFTQVAPVNLIYVADYRKMGKGAKAGKDFCSAADTGFISQNVYLFCASERLATVVLGMVDRPKLATAMKLRPDQKIILTQPVGYPK